MLYRKSLLNIYRLFLKSTNKLWIIPLIIINIIVPAVSYLLYINLREDAEMYIINLIYFILPLSSVWTSIFVSDVFFSDNAKDVLFFYSNKKRLLVSVSFFILSMINSLIIVLLHFNCIHDYLGNAVKIACISVLFYGIAMLILRLSKSSAMAVLILLLYTLVNEFSYSDFFLLYKNYDILTLNLFLIKYLPLVFTALLFILLAFLYKKETKK